MMHYITNINKSNIASQLPLIMTNFKTWKETNNLDTNNIGMDFVPWK